MTTASRPRLRRADSFLGIHFDFHAGDDCREIGRHVTPQMIERIIKLVRPDYLQCDNKGHRGLSSYPTKVGHRAPGFVRDPLRIWRDVTARHGVALYLHHSGVWDTEACKRHPAWARVNADGKRDPQCTSCFGPYVDKLLIPQLKELCDEYGTDGIWIDGDCWSAGIDYHKRIVKTYGKPTGKAGDPADPKFRAYLEYNREAFRRYLRHYTDALHAHNPRFQVASNWAFSSFMPEPVSAAVDFLSGDYALADSINAARWEGRALQHQGVPWDLMAWSFNHNHCTKSIPQLQREAAVVLALGGGFQAYFTQHRDGSIKEWQMELMAAVAKFCRARQRVCHRAVPVPQVGLLLHTAAHFRGQPRVFHPGSTGYLAPQGILNSLLESQYSVEVLMDHHLPGRMDDYPLLVWPEWDYLAPNLKKQLVAYVRRGGNLLVIGPQAAKLFEKELGVSLTGRAEKNVRWLEHAGWLGALDTMHQPVRLKSGTRSFGRHFAKDDFRGPAATAATISRLGKGRIAGVYLNLGERYRKAATPVARQFLAALVRELFPQPLVEVGGSQYVDVSVTRQGRKLAINLVNTAGPHADPNVLVHDEIPPVGPLSLHIQYAQRPTLVTLAPHGTPLPFTYNHGRIRLVLPRLEIHSVVVVTGPKHAAA